MLAIWQCTLLIFSSQKCVLMKIISAASYAIPQEKFELLVLFVSFKKSIKISKNAEFYADFRTVEKFAKKCTHKKL